MDNARIVRITAFLLLLLSWIIEKVFSIDYLCIIVALVLSGLIKLYEKKTGVSIYPKYKKEKFNFSLFMLCFVFVVLVLFVLYILVA